MIRLVQKIGISASRHLGRSGGYSNTRIFGCSVGRRNSRSGFAAGHHGGTTGGRNHIMRSRGWSCGKHGGLMVGRSAGRIAAAEGGYVFGRYAYTPGRG